MSGVTGLVALKLVAQRKCSIVESTASSLRVNYFSSAKKEKMSNENDKSSNLQKKYVAISRYMV